MSYAPRKQKSSTSSSGGISFCSLLTVLFIGLKLTNHIDWSWWWVLAPMWLPITVVLGVCGIMLIGCGVCWCILKSVDIYKDMKRGQE